MQECADSRRRLRGRLHDVQSSGDLDYYGPRCVRTHAHTHACAHTHTHTHGILLLAIQTRARSLFLTIPNARDHICLHAHAHRNVWCALNPRPPAREYEHLCSEPHNHNKCQHIHTETFDVRVFLGRLQESMELMCDEPLSLGYKLASNMDTYQGIWHLTDGMPPSEAPGFVFFCDSLHSHAAEQVS